MNCNHDNKILSGTAAVCADCKKVLHNDAMTTQERLREVLKQVAINSANQYGGFEEWETAEEEAEVLDQAEQALLQLIETEIIGEDEEDDLNPFGMMARSTGRNTLRAEQRTTLRGKKHEEA